MGYRGKLETQDKARRMRAEGRTLQDIAEALGVAKSSVSLWVRDVPFTPSPRRTGAERKAHPQHLAKLAEIEELSAQAVEALGTLSNQAFLAAGAALYAGEGSKSDGKVNLTNTNPELVSFFCAWLRRFFDVDESRLRVTLYLHEGLDLDAAEHFWSGVTGIPRTQFLKAYRAAPNPSIRSTKHPMGCASVRYNCSHTHRAVMGLVRALLSSSCILSGVAQSVAQRTVNATALGSSPSPGA